MFTGIVEEVGTIARIQGGAHSSTLEVCARTVWEDTHVGDSMMPAAPMESCFSRAPTAHGEKIRCA